MPDIIKVENLTKKYGEVVAVNDISFTVREGDLFAFLGPNGAGKSTTVNVICTLLDKTSGRVEVDGCEVGSDDAGVREKIGVVFQDNSLDELLTVKENLITRGGLYGLTGKALHDRAKNVASVMEISDIMNRRTGKLSGGQKRRAEIARALMSDPRALFLDEPTTGLDPQTRIMVWKTIKHLQDKLNMTVFLTTHYMEEAAAADMVAVIDGGKIVATGTPGELKEIYSTDTMKLMANDIAAMTEHLREWNLEFELAVDTLVVQVRDSMTALGFIKKYEAEISSFEVIKGSMDDVFINITGHKIRSDV